MNTEFQHQLPRLIFRRWKSILLVMLVSVICAIFFSSSIFITPLYKAEVILYPPETNSNRILIEHDTRFGNDKENDEFLQILRSAILRDSMAVRYNLLRRYHIDAAGTYAYDELCRAYESRITAERTVFNAIQIKVYDASADTAASIANGLVILADKVKEQILKKNILQAFGALEKQYLQMKASLEAFKTELKSLNVFSPGGEIHLTSQSAKTNDTPLLQQYAARLAEFNAFESKYFEASQKLSEHPPASYVISPAQASAKAVHPVRWLIVLVTAFCALLAMLCIIVVTEWIHYEKQTHS